MTIDKKTVVLVVEDEPRMQRMLQERLEEDGYQVLAAGTAQAVVDLLKQQTIDLILLDLRLDEGSGIDVLEAVRADADHSPAVLVLSNLDNPAMKADVMGWGLAADEYLVKTEHSLDDISGRVATKLRAAAG